MKRLRITIALTLIVLGGASACFWLSAVRDMGKIEGGERPATPVELRQQFPALALATRIYEIDLFAEVGTEESAATIWRLPGQLWRPAHAALIAVGVGLLLLPNWRRKRRARWALTAGGVAIGLFIGLLVLALASSWLRRNDLPERVPYTPGSSAEVIDPGHREPAVVTPP
jgi:hypothetical protein